ncbi:hypothetical protein Tco_1481680 [Tanacetum coccineum]
MVDKQEITYTVDMFRATLMLLVETLEQPFIELGNLKFIQPFLNIVGYQGLVDKFNSVPKRLKEEYHSIKDDTSLVSAYTIGKVTVKGTLIPPDLITVEIRET